MSSSHAILFPPDEQDMISELPEDILLKIISAMDLQTAVQASVLAKRWRDLWTWRIDLNLHHDNLPGYNDKFKCRVSKNIRPEEYNNWVNQVIDAHRGGPFIRKFTLCSRCEIDNRLVEKWVSFAFSKRVEELDLSLVARYGNPIFSMGFDILKQSLINGTFNLKSLRLKSVDVSGEAIEYILLNSPLLERLCVSHSHTLHTLHIFSNKLKHLALMRCYLDKLEIDAVNLISFKFVEHDGVATLVVPPNYKPQIVFKKVPKLVEVYFMGKGFFHPFHFFDQIFPISKQLTKLSFRPKSLRIDEFGADYFDTVKKSLLFSNVKHINVDFMKVNPVTTVFTKILIDLCPKLHGLNLQIDLGADVGADWRKEEAKLLREVKLEGEKTEKMEDIGFDLFPIGCDVSNVRYKNQYHSNLKVLEVSMYGFDDDVDLIMDIINCADSFETLVCTRQRSLPGVSIYDDTITRLARKLAILLAPRRIHVGLPGASGVFWVS